MTDETKGDGMTLEQSIAYLHPHVNSSHNPDWKKKREAWDVLMDQLSSNAVTEVSPKALGKDGTPVWLTEAVSLYRAGRINSAEAMKRIGDKTTNLAAQSAMRVDVTDEAVERAIAAQKDELNKPLVVTGNKTNRIGRAQRAMRAALQAAIDKPQP
jgi:hypothetical protein